MIRLNWKQKTSGLNIQAGRCSNQAFIQSRRKQVFHRDKTAFYELRQKLTIR